jgi:RHS repeat-associated protein
MVGEINTSGVFTAKYVHGAGLISKLDSSNATQYYLYNGHGDVTGLTSASGAMSKSYTYDAFGNERNRITTDTNPFRYSGEYFDNETGNIYLRARYYAPGKGRFTSEDPIQSGLNWYTYCGNNPVSFVDPQGLDAILVNKRLDSAPWSGIDHMGAFFQDENKDWWFYYYGDYVDYHKIVLDDTFKNYDSIFKNIDSINEYLWAHDLYKKENVKYRSSVYVKGDFTESHKGAQEYLSKYTQSLITWNGKGLSNKDYNFFLNNCSQTTMALFYKGTLPDGTNVGKYAAENGYGTGMLPNANIWNMQTIFYNKATNLAGFETALKAEREKYEGKNWFTQWWYSGMRKNINKVS